LTEIKLTIILSTFETINWANKREYENFVSVALYIKVGTVASTLLASASFINGVVVA